MVSNFFLSSFSSSSSSSSSQSVCSFSRLAALPCILTFFNLLLSFFLSFFQTFSSFSFSNGLSYTLNYADEVGKFDEVVEQFGVQVIIEGKAVMHVVGTKMDYQEDRLKSEFVFINPNSKGSCGCGESFTT